jgi:hypothetical protein
MAEEEQGSSSKVCHALHSFLLAGASFYFFQSWQCVSPFFLPQTSPLEPDFRCRLQGLAHAFEGSWWLAEALLESYNGAMRPHHSNKTLLQRRRLLLRQHLLKEPKSA